MSSKVIAGLGAKQIPNNSEQPFGRIMAKIAEKLCMERGWKLHSNGDAGASTFFESGLSEAVRHANDEKVLIRFLPMPGHNSHSHGVVISDEALVAKARSILIDINVYPVIPRFISLTGEARSVLTPDENRLAALHTRTVFQLLGKNLDEPATMVVCWTPDGVIDLAGFKPEVTGSTGIAIALAELNPLKKIPVFNLHRRDHLERICAFIGEPVPGSDG